MYELCLDKACIYLSNCANIGMAEFANFYKLFDTVFSLDSDLKDKLHTFGRLLVGVSINDILTYDDEALIEFQKRKLMNCLDLMYTFKR